MESTVRLLDDEQILGFFDAALPEVYGYLLHRCGDKATAEDLTSESLLAAVRGIRARPPESLSAAWLIGIARHKLVDHWRSEARRARNLQLWTSSHTEELPEEEFEPGRALEVLATLNPMQRAALTLRYVDGLSVSEVAAANDRSVTATETLLARARSAFRFRYQQQEGDDV